MIESMTLTNCFSDALALVADGLVSAMYLLAPFVSMIITRNRINEKKTPPLTISAAMQQAEKNGNKIFF